MEGLTIAILALTLLSTVGFGWMTRRGSLAQAPVTAEFPLAPLAAAHIAGVAALTAKERSSREPVDVMRTDDGYRVEVGCRAGVMTFDIVGLGEGSRCRVEARAGDLTQIGLPDIGGSGYRLPTCCTCGWGCHGTRPSLYGDGTGCSGL